MCKLLSQCYCLVLAWFGRQPNPCIPGSGQSNCCSVSPNETPSHGGRRSGQLKVPVSLQDLQCTGQHYMFKVCRWFFCIKILSSPLLCRITRLASPSVRPFVCFVQARNSKTKQESRAVARTLRDAAAVLFGLKFADNIHYKFKSSQASKARLQSSKHSGAK